MQGKKPYRTADARAVSFPLGLKELLLPHRRFLMQVARRNQHAEYF
jgi:hypothetical protein